MVAILEKSEHNIDFHTIVDFVEASPLRIETTEDGIKILATVDGILRTVTESSLRRNLKLQDEERISSSPDSELFENLTPMGYNISPNQKFTFQNAQELEISRLKIRVKLLKGKEGLVGERSGDDAPIKGKNLDEGEAAAERVSDDTKIWKPDVVPTASLVFATATVVTPYRRRKGKEIMVESKTPKKKKVQEQIDAQIARDLEEQMAREDQRMSEQVARDAEIARIHAEEELQSMIDGLDRSNETVAKYLQEYQQFASELPLERRIELISDLVRYQDNYAKVHKYQSQQRKPWSKKQKRDYYMAVIRSNLGWISTVCFRIAFGKKN
nr:hypothetical protein [Tanacetum cinerariifolium]